GGPRRVQDGRRVLPGHVPAGPAVLAVLRAAAARLRARPAVLRDPGTGSELRGVRGRGGPRLAGSGAGTPVGGRRGVELLALAAPVPGGVPAGVGADDPAAEQSADPAPQGQRPGQLHPAAGPDLSD